MMQSRTRHGMTLKDLTAGLDISLVHGSAQAEIADIVEDSRQVSAGCLFVARAGLKADGRRFIDDAVKAGAVAVLCEDGQMRVPANVAVLTATDLPETTAKLAERFFGDPSSQLTLIGITGTNGKTTTAYLVREILNRAGVKCGLIGTVQIDDGKEVREANLTTPPAIEISRVLRTMIDHGCQACVMEASSHALHQKRTAGLSFKIGVFTNLTGDHLDYHQTMENYRAAKGLLFESLPKNGVAVLNADEDASLFFASRTKAAVLKCSAAGKRAQCSAQVGEQTLSSIQVEFDGPWGSFGCKLPLIGRHNVSNALQALAVAHVMDIKTNALQEIISACHAPPGRLEPVTDSSHDFAILVDYAHTDDALENVLRTLRPIVSDAGAGKLITIFGCGGDRDRTKRPRMARVACQYSDEMIITSDNPRTECPSAIINEIRSGIPHEKLNQTTCIEDRKAAIEAAVDRLCDGDILLIAGKGHEDYQIIGTTKRAFDDRKIASAALRAKVAGASL
jgi:UDP-N-acetylmuramoyl-L-alanyl-D-glutamate--2,6-diaminopimelate ligase